VVGAVSARIRVVLFSEVNSKFGAPFLDALSHDPRVSLTALVTSPPGQVCDYYVGEPKPVDLEARAHEQGIPVHRPASVNDASSVARLRELHADYHLIGNFQQIFKPELLAVPIRATVNFHPSPLPRYAGLAPFFWMARNGERHGGASALIAKPLVDAGPLLARKYIPLDGTETAGEIRNLHFSASVELLHLVLPRLVDHDLAATPQDLAGRTYFGRPSPDDRRVDWKADTETVLRTIRACLPRPGAEANLDGRQVRLLEVEPLGHREHGAEPGETLTGPGDGLLVATGDGWVRLRRYEKEGEHD